MFQLNKCVSLILGLTFYFTVIVGQIQDNITTKPPGHKAHEMCKKYSTQTVRCPITNIPLILVPRIQEGEFPHLVQIGYKGNQIDTIDWLCAGALVSEMFVLSTAHCMIIHSTGEKPKFVRAGITHGSQKRNAQVRNVATIFVHPDFTYSGRYNDISLIKVDKPFDLNYYVKPGCLHTEKHIPESKVIHTGWTAGSYMVSEAEIDMTKQFKNIVPNEICNKTFAGRLRNGVVEDKLICTGFDDGGKDSCQYDFGGLLQIIHKDTEDIKCMYDVIGVPSFTSSCGLNTPSVYTRVSNYIKWIEEIVWKSEQ